MNEDAWNFAPVKRLVDFVSDASDDDFKDSFEQYFNKDSILRYYLFDMFIGGIDGLSKNFHLCSWDGQIFYCLPYDLDSCLGGN
ncbi:CotH kinase family protein [Clostridium sp.]|uniref:CotH kinase family protein n=1 Tax=Clostridium sp. TaxID=1506 RepID=UPI0025BA3F0D|nr:CotH kinase family protein [Clostridium sp.]